MGTTGFYATTSTIDIGADIDNLEMEATTDQEILIELINVEEELVQ